MDPTPWILFGAVFVIVASVLFRRRPAPDLAELRAGWSRPVERERNDSWISAYHRAIGADGAIDDRSWADLGLDDIFALLDRTVTPIGQQVLYDMLRRPLFSKEVLEARQRLADHFLEHHERREQIQLTLGRLRANALYDIHDLFTSELPDRPRTARLFPILSIAAIVTTAGIFVYPPLLLALPLLAITNFVVPLRSRQRISIFIHTLAQVDALLGVAKELVGMPDPGSLSPRDRLTGSVERLAPLRRYSRWLVFERANTNELASIVYTYLNYFFLLDVNAFSFALDAIRAGRQDLRDIFEAIGSIDAMISVASFRAGSRTASPRFHEPARRLEADALCHPLLVEPVANDVRIDGHSLLVTGSNMSGKTTFIRSVAVGAVMAQTIHAVTAARWDAPFLDVRTSIGGRDDLMEGKSYYLAEVERIAELYETSGRDRQALFVIDELFRGTNTIERIAAGAAILDHLNRGNHLVIASTHDLELVDLVEHYQFQHFAETVSDGRLEFDYKLKPGRSSTRNAIRILELCGFPREVVARADSIAKNAVERLDVRDRDVDEARRT